LHVRDDLQGQPVGARRRGRGADAARLGRRGRALHPLRTGQAYRMTATAAPGRGDYGGGSGRRRRPLTWRRVALYVLLIALAALYLVPVYVVLVGSLKTGTEISTSSIWAAPHEIDLGAWGSALTPPRANAGGIAPGMFNSLIMTLPAVVISSLWGAVNGYALSAWRFRGSGRLVGLILVRPLL